MLVDLFAWVRVVTMARWGDDKTLNFIFHYRSYECLWNVRSPQYKNKISRVNAYQRLLESMNDDNLTLKSVKTKIKNLRSIYHTELKKMKDSKPSGSNGSIYKPTLLWFEEMHSFLGDSREYRKSVSSEIETQVLAVTNNPEHSTLNDSSTVDNITELPKKNTNVATLKTNLLDSQSTSNNNLKQSDQQSRKPKLVRNKKQNHHNSIVNALQRLENIAEAINITPRQQTVDTQDEFYFFGQSVAAQLRNLPLHIAIDIQSKIQNSLSVARLSSIISISNTPSPSSSCNYNFPSYIVTDAQTNAKHVENQVKTNAQYVETQNTTNAQYVKTQDTTNVQNVETQDTTNAPCVIMSQSVISEAWKKT